MEGKFDESHHHRVEIAMEIHKVETPPKRSSLQKLKNRLKETFFPDDPLRQFKGQSIKQKWLLGFQYIFPILQWGPQYNLNLFKSDVVSGLTIASLAIPQGISYAKLANLPPIVGLYSSFVPPLVYAILGSSRDLAVGPVSIASLLMGSMLRQEVSPTQDPILFLQLAFTSTFFAGLFQASLGFLRLGFIIDFLSKATLIGFMAGAAIIVSLQQLKALLGITHFTKEMGLVPVMSSVFHNTKEWSWQTILMGSSFLIFLLVTRHIAKMDLFTVVQLAKPAAVKTGVRPLRDDEEPILAATSGRVMELAAGDTGTSSSVAVEATPLQSRPNPEVTPVVAQSSIVAVSHPEEEEEEEAALSRKRARRDDGAGPSRKKRPVVQTVELSSTDEASSHPSADDAEPKMEQVIESPPKASPIRSAHSEPQSQDKEDQSEANVPLGQLVEELVQVSAHQASVIVKLKDQVSDGENQDSQKDQTISLLEAQLASTRAQLDSAHAEAKVLSTYAQKQAEDKMALMCQINKERADAAKYKSACCWALKHLDQGKESLFAQLGELGNTVSWSLEVQEAKLRKLSIEYDEELYPHLMSMIAERRWLIGHGLRLAALSTLESSEVVTAFGEVVQCALERGKSEAMEKLHEAKLLKAPLDKVPGYDSESYDHLVAAMQKMKDLELPMISELERDQDYPINVIMTGLTLARHRAEGADTQPDYFLKPHESQLQVPVFARPRDSQDPFALEKEVPLKEVLEAHATRLAKKKGIAGKAILCGLGAAHLPRSDGVPVSVATVSPNDAYVLKSISEVKEATSTVGTSSLRRCSSL